MRGIVLDLRAALRGLLARPALSLFLVLTLAVGLSASGTIFGLVDALVLRPLPFKGMDSLVMAWETYPSRDPFDRWTVAPANFLDWKDATPDAFETLVAMDGWATSITGRDVPEQVEAFRVSAGFFETLGATPLQGRLLAPEDFAGDGRRVVLGYDLWQRAFGGSAGVVGTTVKAGGAPFIVVGIVRPGFSFPTGAQAWAPLVLAPGAAREEHQLTVIGRLRPGVPREEAGARLSVVAGRLAREHP